MNTFIKSIKKNLLVCAMTVGLCLAVTPAHAVKYQVLDTVQGWAGHTMDEFTEAMKRNDDSRYTIPNMSFDMDKNTQVDIFLIKYTETRFVNVFHDEKFVLNNNCKVKFLVNKEDKKIIKGELFGSDLACSFVSRKIALNPSELPPIKAK